MNQNTREIVFINQATGYLTIDIVNAFASKFDAVALISGSVRIQDIPLNQSVKCKKIIKYNRGNPLKKFISWIIGTFQIFWLLRTRFRDYDIFYFTVPPTAYLLSLILPNRFSILVFDIYPDSLKVFKVKESNFLYTRWQKWNTILFSRAYRIYTLGKAMKKELLKYTDPEKIITINNWSGLTKLNPVSKQDNPFVQTHHLSDKFIVSYSGNIGHTHNVESIVYLAEELIKHEKIVFVIIGRGKRVDVIRQLIKAKGLTNCILLPFLPDDEIQFSLSAADVSIVILDEKVAGYSIPSKTYNLLAVGSAFMCIGSEESELAGFVAEHNIGKSFTQHNITGMIEYLLELSVNSELLNTYKKNSLKISKDFTSKNAELYLKYYLAEAN